MSFAMDYETMKQELKGRLKATRFRHSLGVSETAVRLARRFGVDEQQARVAGLLHDCAREFPNEAMIAEAEKRHLPIGTVERSMPLLLHGPIGSRRVRGTLRCRRSGRGAGHRPPYGGRRAYMTPLDKIIWFADMIEPNRDYPGVEKLRKLAREATLDEMLLEGLSDSIAFVLAKRHLIHPDTVLARNEILLKMKKEA